jgi:hypothetical protein
MPPLLGADHDHGAAPAEPHEGCGGLDVKRGCARDHRHLRCVASAWAVVEQQNTAAPSERAQGRAETFRDNRGHHRHGRPSSIISLPEIIIMITYVIITVRVSLRQARRDNPPPVPASPLRRALAAYAAAALSAWAWLIPDAWLLVGCVTDEEPSPRVSDIDGWVIDGWH